MSGIESPSRFLDINPFASTTGTTPNPFWYTGLTPPLDGAPRSRQTNEINPFERSFFDDDESNNKKRSAGGDAETKTAFPSSSERDTKRPKIVTQSRAMVDERKRSSTSSAESDASAIALSPFEIPHHSESESSASSPRSDNGSTYKAMGARASMVGEPFNAPLSYGLNAPGMLAVSSSAPGSVIYSTLAPAGLDPSLGPMSRAIPPQLAERGQPPPATFAPPGAVMPADLAGSKASSTVSNDDKPAASRSRGGRGGRKSTTSERESKKSKARKGKSEPPDDMDDDNEDKRRTFLERNRQGKAEMFG
jgi:hypothetical protein